MPAYVVVQLEPTDEDALKRYYEVGGAAVKKHGGAALAGGPDKAVLEENGAGTPAHVLISFPDVAAAHAWMDDPELADVHALRRSAAKTTITLLPAM